MAGGYSRSPVPRSLTSALERLMVSSESMMKWTRSSCSTHSCKLGGRSMGVSRSMFTNRVATYSQRTGGLIYSPKVRQAPPEPQQRRLQGRITLACSITLPRTRCGSGEPRSGPFSFMDRNAVRFSDFKPQGGGIDSLPVLFKFLTLHDRLPWATKRRDEPRSFRHGFLIFRF